MLRESLTRLSITLEEFGDAANRWERNGGSLIHLPGPFQKLRGEIERVRALLQDTQILSLLEADASVDDIILLPLEDAATALEELRQDAEWASKEQAIPSILPRGSDFLRDYLKRISNCRLAVEALLDIQQQSLVLQRFTIFDDPAIVDNEQIGRVELLPSTPGIEAYTDLPTRVPRRRILTFSHSRCRPARICFCHRVAAGAPAQTLAELDSLRQMCDNPSCLTRWTYTTRVVLLPFLFKKRVEFTIVRRGLSIQNRLRVYSLVPGTFEALMFAEIGYTEGLRDLILSKKASIFDAGSDGWNYLHSAVYHQHLDCTEFLLQCGVDGEVEDEDGRKPIHYARFRVLNYSPPEDALQIWKHFKQFDEFKSDFELSPIICAAIKEYEAEDRKRPSLEELLLFAKSVADCDPSNWLALKRELRLQSPLYRETVGCFIEGKNHGKRPEQILRDLIEQTDTKQKWTPLFFATFAGWTREVKVLLDWGADPFVITPVGRNILHHAAESTNDELLELLLHRGLHNPRLDEKSSSSHSFSDGEQRVDINLHDKWGETPLHVACSKRCRSAELLLEHGAYIGVRQSAAETALHYVRHQKPSQRLATLEMLLSRIEPRSWLIDAKNTAGAPCLFHLLDSPDCVRKLLEWEADLNIVDSDGRNVLHHACMHNHHASLAILLKAGASHLVTEVDSERNTPLFIAFRKRSVDCVRVLIERQYHHPWMTDKEGWTILHHAVKLEDQRVWELVLTIPEAQRMARIKTKDGKTALSIAKAQGCSQEFIETLSRQVSRRR